MKNLLFASALLICFATQAQNSFKLKKGAELTYQIDENGMVYDLTVTIIDLKPFKVDYKNADGTLKGFTSVGNNSKEQYFKYDYFLPGNGGRGALLVLPDDMFKSIQQLEQNSKAGITEDTTSIAISFSDNTTIPFGRIGFQQEDIKVDKGTLTLHTYAVDQMGVGFGDGYIMRVNADPNTPIVTYLNDVKGKLSIHLVAVKSVETYEYIK